MAESPTGPEIPVDGTGDSAAGAEQARTLSRTIVAGIGASAGGIQALQEFFSALPDDLGVAFVVVVHLSPEHRSQLASILATRTAMPVEQVTETIPLQPNRAYVIPPDRQLQITDSEIGAIPFDEPRGRRAPIDFFFRSLAEQHGDGFAVILSGGGSDGAVGVTAVKEGGGLVLVQDPAEAAHPSMPRAAIATNVADLVLPVRELAQRLVELTHAKRRLQASVPPDTAAPLGSDTDMQVGRILAHVHARTGHDFSRYKRGTVIRRLKRRMQVQRTETLQDYFGYLRAHAEESNALFDDLLISVTRFFRDPASWNALAERVIPKLFEEHDANTRLRVWVPGCATGEEAYSAAILLLEEAHRRDVWPQIQIFASDLDDRSLERGREGVFPSSVRADLTDERLDRFFRAEGDHYRVTKELRDCVLFTRHNILRDPPFSRLDLVCCRNLLIYLDRELQQQLFGVFHYALRPGRYLFLGASETADENYFRLLDKKSHIYQSKVVSAQDVPRLPELLLATPRVRSQEAFEPPPPAPVPSSGSHRAALEELAPPSVLVNEDRVALHLSESAGRFLRPPAGPLTRDITRLVRPELTIELSAALTRVFEQGLGGLSAPVLVQLDGAPRRVAVLVRPKTGKRGERIALVMFIESDEASSPPNAADAAPGQDGVVHRLQGDLRDTRERLARTREEAESGIEELRAANEELQSINEEYRSTAEELETSKEELQSINEELETVNHELKLKLQEVMRAHSDLENLMSATQIPTLFLDRGLRIARFTPPLSELFNLAEGDRGRPITDFTHRLQYTALQADVRRVIERLVPIEREVSTDDGRWFLMRVRPYRTIEDRIDGVVVTFVDFTARRNAEEELRRSEEKYRLLVEGVEEYAIILIGSDGRITTWNSGASKLFGRTGEEAVGQHASILFTEQDRQSGAVEREMTIAARDGTASDDRWHVRKDGARFWASGVMTALREPSGRLRGFAKILRDNTRRLESEAAKLHFQALFESAPGLYAVLRPLDYTIVAASDAFLEATWTRREEIVGRSIFSVFPEDRDDTDDPDDPDSARSVRASFERVKSERRADAMAVARFPIRRPDAEGEEVEERWWSPVSSPIFGPSGELTYIVLRLEDVTPFVRQMREQQREDEGHQLLESRAQLLEAEILLRTKDVERANAQLRKLNEVLEDRGRERERLLVAAQDARAEAEQQRAEALAASEAKVQFLTNMSHELRTPLNAIAGHVQLLDMELHGPVSPAQRDALGRVERAQRHLMGLINNILNFARLDTGKVDYDVHPTDLGALMNDIAPMIEPQLRAKQLDYEVRTPDGEFLVWADADKLRQILLNLLANAAKFTSPGGQVVMDVGVRAATPGLAYLRVRDTGIGIPRERQNLIFDPFVQAHRTLTQSTEGSGLGLAISRDLARGMGGELRVRSSEGGGSTFTVTLRRVRDHEGDPDDPGIEFLRTSGNGSDSEPRGDES